MTLTEKQIKAIHTITFHLEDIREGLQFGQFLPEDVEAIRQACDDLVSPWRPISEPPEEIDYYAVLVEDGAFWQRYYWDGKEWDGTWTNSGKHAITHWMPLPSLPEVEP